MEAGGSLLCSQGPTRGPVLHFVTSCLELSAPLSIRKLENHPIFGCPRLRIKYIRNTPLPPSQRPRRWARTGVTHASRSPQGNKRLTPGSWLWKHLKQMTVADRSKGLTSQRINECADAKMGCVAEIKSGIHRTSSDYKCIPFGSE
jgi:hypothetical protein